MKTKRIFYLLVAVSFLWSCFSPSAYAFKNVKAGDAALDFTLKDVKGNEIKLADYSGKNVFAISFWNLSVENNIAALSVLNQLYNWYHKENGLEVFAVYCPPTATDINEEEIGKINKLIEENKISFPILLDHQQKIYNLYGVISFPSFMVVGKEGNVSYLLPFWNKLKGEEDIKNNVKKALGLEVVEAHQSKQSMSVKAKFKPQKGAAIAMNAADELLKEGETEKAIPKLKQAIEEDPKYVQPHIMLASIYASQGKMDEALIEFGAAIDIDPNEIQTRLDYGFFSLEKGMVDDALAQFIKALEIDPKSGDAHYGLGVVNMKKGQKEEAKAEFKQALDIFEAVGGDLFNGMRKKREIHPNLANSYNDLGEILLAEGKKEEAIQHFKKASEEYQRIIEKLVKSAK